MSKFTPGPWIAIHSIPEQGVECFWLNAQPSGGICRGFSQEIGTINGPQSGEQEANARLIAAAPDLLKALINLRHGSDLPGGPALAAMQDAADAAIAKATGASHE